MMYKNSFMKTGLIFLVFILFIGLSSIHGFSSQVPIEKRIDRVLVVNPQFMDSNDCSMWMDNMTVHPGETYDIPVHGSWSFTMSGLSIGLQFNPDVFEFVGIHRALTISDDAFTFQYVEPIPGLLSIGAAWMPSSYKPAGSGILVRIIVNVAGDAAPGEHIVNLGNFGGFPPVGCEFADEFSIVHYPELTDGTLTVMQSTDCSMWINNMTVSPGETYVTCYIQGSWPFTISGYNIGLQFDPAVIEDISVFWMHPPPVAAWIIIEPSLLAIGCAWMPGNYIPPGSGVLATLHIDIFEDAESGETILDLDNFGGDPPIDCIYSDESSVEHYPELTDGALFIVECADIDSNGNGPDIADLVYLVDYMFQEGPAPHIMCQADIDANGVGPDIADLVYLVDYMFQGGPSPGDCCNPPW